MRNLNTWRDRKLGPQLTASARPTLSRSIPVVKYEKKLLARSQLKNKSVWSRHSHPCFALSQFLTHKSEQSKMIVFYVIDLEVFLQQ